MSHCSDCGRDLSERGGGNCERCESVYEQEAKYIAIMLPGYDYYTWYERGSKFGPHAKPDGCVETVYHATGKTVKRLDGALAEIYK